MFTATTNLPQVGVLAGTYDNYPAYMGTLYFSMDAYVTNLYLDGPNAASILLNGQNHAYPSTSVNYFAPTDSCYCCFIPTPLDQLKMMLHTGQVSYVFGRTSTARGVRTGSMWNATNPAFRYIDDDGNLAYLTTGSIDFFLCENKNSVSICPPPTTTTTTETTTTTTAAPVCGKLRNKFHKTVFVKLFVFLETTFKPFITEAEVLSNGIALGRYFSNE